MLKQSEYHYGHEDGFVWLKRVSETVKKNCERDFESDAAYYSQDVFDAIKRLSVVFIVQNRLEGFRRYCWPLGTYNTQDEVDRYDITSTTAMESLQVETITTDNQHRQPRLIKNRSLQETLQSLDAKSQLHCRFKHLKRRIQDDIALNQGMNEACFELCEQIQYVLSTLEQLVTVVNQGPDWQSIYAKSGIKMNPAHQYDLSSEESILNLNILTREGLLVLHSLQYWLKNIDEIEKAKYLFNQVCECVMPEVYRLQELAAEEKQSIIANLMKARASYISESLQRLHDEITRKYRYISNSNFPKFESITALLDIKIAEKMSLREAIVFSEDNLVVPEELRLLIPNTLESLHQTTLNFQRPLGQQLAMYKGMRTSLVLAKNICSLTECGDLDQIIQMNPSVDNINLLIDVPLELKLASIGKNVQYTLHYFPSVYAGKYNALILAVLYRYTAIVEYFLSKGADPTIKGGRAHDISLEVAAFLPGLKPCPPELLEVLGFEPKLIDGHFGHSGNFHKPASSSDAPGQDTVKTPERCRIC